MVDLSYKIRISLFWFLQMIAFFAYRTIALSEGATEVSELNNIDFATALAVIMLFGFLTLLLPTKHNRRMNIIAGSVFCLMQVIMIVDGLTAYPTAIFNLMTGVSVIAMAAVIWLAVKWPKQKASTKPGK